ncbi:MAG: LamG domain-containing protein, partial [Bacteroidota bacterium]
MNSPNHFKNIILALCFAALFTGTLNAQNITLAGAALESFQDSSNPFGGSRENAVRFNQIDFTLASPSNVRQLSVYTEVSTATPVKFLQDDGTGNYVEIGEFVFESGADTESRLVVSAGTQLSIETSQWTLNTATVNAGDYRITGEFYRPDSEVDQFHILGLLSFTPSTVTIAGNADLSVPVAEAYMSNEDLQFTVNAPFSPEELVLIQKTTASGDIQLQRKVGDAFINEMIFTFDRIISSSSTISITNTGEGLLLQENLHVTTATRILPPGEYRLQTTAYQEFADIINRDHVILDDNDFFDLRGATLGPVEIPVTRGALGGDITFNIPLGSLLNGSHIQGTVQLSYRNLDNEWIHFANVIESTQDISGGSIAQLYYDGGRGGRYYSLELLDTELHYQYSLFPGGDGITYLSLSMYKEDFNNQSLTIYHRSPLNSAGSPCSLQFGLGNDRGDCFPRRDSIVVEASGRIFFSDPFLINENTIDGTQYLSILGDNGLVDGSMGVAYSSPIKLSTGSSLFFNGLGDILRPSLNIYDFSGNNSPQNTLDRRDTDVFQSLFLQSDDFPFGFFGGDVFLEARIANGDLPWSESAAISADNTVGQSFSVTGEFQNTPYEFRWLAKATLSNVSYTGARSSQSTFDMRLTSHASGIVNEPVIFENNVNDVFTVSNYTVSNADCDQTITINFQLDGTDAFTRARNHELHFYRREAGQGEPFQPYDTLSPGTALPYDISWVDHNATEGTEYEYTIVSRVNSADALYPVLQLDTISAISALATAIPENLAATSTATATERYIDLTWTHGDNRNTGFLIHKTWELDGVSEEDFITISDPDARAYRDEDLLDCVEYTYQVGSVGDCQPDGEFAPDDSVVVVAEPFLREIVSPEILSASKGYFSNSVLLGWTYNDESPVLQRVKIYKRELGDDVEPALTTILNAQELSYIDEEVETNVYYEYFLIVEGTCQGEQFDSYDITQIVGLDLPNDLPEFGVAYDVGFKSSSAVISGNISYEGGIGVPDVRVAVDRERDSDGNLVKDQAGANLFFDGTDQDATMIETSSFLSFSDELSLMAWISPQDTLRSEQSLLYQTDAYELKLEESEVVFSIRDAGGTWHEARTHVRFDFDVFTHITATANSEAMTIYVDGAEAGQTDLTAFSFHTPSNDITLGYKTATDHYHGYLDELRIYSIALDDETVLRDYQRIVPSTTPGLAAYWRLDEGISGSAYDAARTGNVFHQNDFRLNGADWSTNLPTVEQLAVAAYTNAAGNYVIEGINFQGVGENLTVSPRITLNGAIHEFSPAERGLFIGEGNLINNNIDFTDISSFEVSGQAFYAFETVDGDSTVGVEGASFLLNGITPLFDSDNNSVTTDDEGLFTISVPIGNHFIQIRKNGHVFDEGGRFPATGTFDFQDDVFGVVFYDTTRLSLKGKVVGGLREGDKKLGDPTTKNNIGETTFTLQYPASNPRFVIPVVTDADNGEYSVALPPLPFFVQGNDIDYTKSGEGSVPFNMNFEAIDMSDKFVVQYDTIEYYDDGALDRVDSVGYNFKQNFIYRIEPNILVTNGSGGQVFGEEFFTYADGTDDAVDIPLYTVDGSGQPTYSLGYPVFARHTDYTFRIKLRETYSNVDDGTQDEVPVTDGVLTIANNWGESYFLEDGERLTYPQAASGADQIQVDNPEGEITYRFLSLTPEPADQGQNSFTKTFQISANTGGNNTVFYPGPAQADVARAYVFGSRLSEGSSFVTSGPDRVDFILRDPQGSDSYSYWETGSVLETEETMRWDVGQELELEANVGFSMTTWIGIGGGTVNTVGSTVDVNFSESFKAGEENVRVSTVETTQRYQTSDENVGPSGDVFIGKSENFTTGLSTNVYLIPIAECMIDGKDVCPNDMAEVTHAGETYRVGVKPGFFLSPNGEVTYFVFNQFYIEGTLIPSLEQIRNAVLANNADYSVVFNDTDDPDFALKYGSNNDDPIWGSAASTNNYPKTDDADFTGPSYSFTPSTAGDIDSVRWTNQQIRLWIEALARNEEDKIKAIDENDLLFENLSISGGNQFNFETSTSAKESREEFYELDLALGTGNTVEFNAFGLENDLQIRPSIRSSSSSRTITTETETSTVGFELLDRDSEDLLNISVLNSQFGFGPIFRNRDGGITSCPYEPTEITKYYQPGREWSTGTLQIDKPRLEVEVPQVFNVPSDEAAVFTLNLFNDSETNSDVNYLMRLVDGTNQDGAVLRVDGAVLTDGREFFIPGGSAIQKTLTLERGPLKFDYEGIQVQLMSTCQNDPTGFFEAIADTVSLSANFIPTCTDVAVIDPEPSFTLNNSVGSLVDITVAEYDINFSGLEKIDIEFKASESNDWTKLATYWYDTTGFNDDEALQIPRSASQITYLWDISSGIP